MASYDDTATVSGSVVSIENGADDVPTKSLVVTIPPTLSGVSSVTETQTGRNLFDKDNANVANGYIDVSAFNTGNASAKTIYIPIKGGVKYTVSKTVGARFSIATSDVIPTSGATYTSRQAGNTSASLTITAGANDTYLWAWVFLDGTDTGTLAEMLSSVQIEYGSTAHAYEPYTAPTQYTAQLGRTIYGGTADIVNGVGTDENGNDFTFTGQEIPTRLGYNAFWSDSGDTELTYYKSGYGFTSVTVNKTGKNLFDISKVATTGTTAGISWSISGNEITISGTATFSGWKTLVDFKLPHKGTYHFHMNATGNVGYFLRGWTHLVGKDVAEVCNDPSQTYRIAIAVATSGQSYSGTISEIQIEVGDAYTSYEPYEAVTKTAKLHKVIYGGEVDVIKGTAKPKNLFNEDWEVGGINDATGLPNSETNKIRSKTFSSIKGGATCYVGVPKNIRVLFYASDESFISETANIMNSTFTTPVNCSLFKIRGTVDYGTTYNDDIIICYGSSASDYAPHFDPFTFPPISMSTDEGENTLFANEGTSAITYRKAVD